MNSSDTARSRYDAWHDRYPVDADTNTPWHRLVRQHLDPHRDLDGRRILEIGCGRGGFACWMATQSTTSSEIVAADFSITAIEKARAFAVGQKISGVSWEVGDIQHIAHRDESFDTAVSCETIEHVPDPRRAIGELARILRPGGRLFLTTPNYLGTMGLYRIFRRLTGRPYTEEGQPINNPLLLPLTRSWVSRAGLRVLFTSGVGQYLPVRGRPPLTLSWLEQPRGPLHWLALHSLIVAEKPCE
jgi:2-polyprenyl-3-methyl-5-hydroxy-6-metoxy-1,4-benzoquinol methylase